MLNWNNSLVDDGRISDKLQKAEFGLFAAILCAEASIEKLCTVAKSFAWYFIWDDIFDCGALKYNSEGAKCYRQASIKYFEHQLLLDRDLPDLSLFPLELQKALLCWDEVGSHIREVCPEETRAILLDRMVEYVASVDNVDSLYNNGTRIPTLQEYWERRECTAGVYPVIATIPFAYGLNITITDVENPYMKKLWRHTSYLVHITNDMFSMRKEIVYHRIQCHDAMQVSYAFAMEEASKFQQVENILLLQPGKTSEVISDAFVRGCKDVVMGLVHWSYSGTRYFQETEIGADHVIRFQIDSSPRYTKETELKATR
ncbi:isoprenoid synthase domain-containing protein [Aspergillus pseudonomiae]|uniref:Terpene synthase n=1 Tax=Aspergillus pseudonomiae TaxID=1506151 RepID=A0A5N7DDJ5_9EURO|nr:isoprenoid synthase domain-containing protein [Aspergillus pseudonomiae]KAE8404309.1 isoprenoid synthase domain-containing protein [Aspergillus pseudonomiae]